MNLEERWREREKARVKARKQRALVKPEKIEVKPAVPPLVPGQTFKVPKDVVEILFTSPVDHPKPKTKLEQVVDALGEFKMSISDVSIGGMSTRSGLASIGVSANVKPLPNPLLVTNNRPDIRLHHGPLYSFTMKPEFAKTPEDAVKLARRYLVELITHEIDEWLFQAGLGPNPHNWDNGMIPSDHIGKVSDRFRE